MRSFFHWFTPSLIHSLIQVIHWFMLSLHSLNPSLIASLVSSSLKPLIDSWTHCLIGWLIDSFVRSFIRSVLLHFISCHVISFIHVNRAFILSCHSIGISTAICLFVDVPHNLNISLLRHLTDMSMSIGRLFLTEFQCFGRDYWYPTLSTFYPYSRGTHNKTSSVAYCCECPNSGWFRIAPERSSDNGWSIIVDPALRWAHTHTYIYIL